MMDRVQPQISSKLSRGLSFLWNDTTVCPQLEWNKLIPKCRQGVQYECMLCTTMLHTCQLIRAWLLIFAFSLSNTEIMNLSYELEQAGKASSSSRMFVAHMRESCDKYLFSIITARFHFTKARFYVKKGQFLILLPQLYLILSKSILLSRLSFSRRSQWWRHINTMRTEFQGGDRQGL